ncbi:MAG: trypsin-like peptidase domain-containing protein [Aquamicrobium sp.]|uniref:S1 family peptidase n=1 Tax=Mesorhizobium sp. Pch-S TaxID=2082387 RepID=UPI001010D0F4|nr:serine protease [Mesorhizobium sp. Pch-S]MBR2691508.1 trypsin-like peptidase domain-containing protein [Aquamicrobium sp.]QAZ44274.1 serine protease [Mesorhizobium sp. Pch-S]
MISRSHSDRLKAVLLAAFLALVIGPVEAQTSKPQEQAPAINRQLTGTAFYVDETGHMLTARHAVENCARLIITKESKQVDARVVAVSDRYDIALIKTRRTQGLAAVFPRASTADIDDMMFAAGYDALAGLLSGGGVLANARVISSFGGSEMGHLVLDSPVRSGASGAPVLDRNGLVQGVVSRRTMINRVLAVGATEARSFLARQGVHVRQDDRPQIAANGSRAHRAASISARVTCLQR